MFTFADDERASLGWMRGITQDPQGRAVLVGLTFEETDFYVTSRIRSANKAGSCSCEIHGRKNCCR